MAGMSARPKKSMSGSMKTVTKDKVNMPKKHGDNTAPCMGGKKSMTGTRGM